MLRKARWCLLAAAALLAASAAAQGQEAATQEKQAAVARLLELEDPQARGYATFARVMDRFRDASAGILIKSMKADGLFSKLSPAEGAELERRIRVFERDVMEEYKARMLREVGTRENLSRAIAPALARDFTLEELKWAIAFDESPLGRKVLALLPGLLAESTVSYMEAKGFFDEPPSPEAAAANLGRLTKEMWADPAGYARRIFEGAMPALERQLTPGEVKELKASRDTPFGRRYAEVYWVIQGENLKLFNGQYGARAGVMLNEIYARKLKEYAPWLSEASRPGALPGGPTQPPAKPQGPEH